MLRHSAYAPGRVELLGNHTDYNKGTVLAAALDIGVTIEGEASGDDKITIKSSNLQRSATTSVATMAAVADEPWASYLIGVAKELKDLGYPISGFDAEFNSTIPVGAGLSSSAALEVATGMLLQKLFEFTLPPMHLAKVCRRAENRFVGVSCGLLDQATSVFGRRNYVVHLDCREESVEMIPMPEDCQLLITNSNVQHNLTGGEYNERRDSCLKAARKLGVQSLRDVSPEQLESHIGELDDLLLRRSRHVVGEIDRVRRGSIALRDGDVHAFGKMMFESHHSSIVNFENSTKELDALVEIARDTPGVLGSRLTGGGFGGATVSLIRKDAVAAASERIAQEYQQRCGLEATILVCKVADGAS